MFLEQLDVGTHTHTGDKREKKFQKSQFRTEKSWTLNKQDKVKKTNTNEKWSKKKMLNVRNVRMRHQNECVFFGNGRHHKWREMVNE